MKQMSDAWHARLSEETLSLCLCWRLTRRDQHVLGLTNHDQSLSIEGVLYLPGAMLGDAYFSHGASLQPGTADADGVLSHPLIEDDDLRAGDWDDCKIDVFRADWRAPELGLWHVWSGYLSRVTRDEAGQFRADLVSLSVDLQRPIGRIVQRLCDAELGDERCGAVAEGRTCDQRFETCRDVFRNVENFRGFPHLPGTDAILAGPSITQNDGGKR